MNEQDPKPVLWSTILFRVAMLLVLLAALAMAFAPELLNLFSPQRRLTTSGDPADIRLVGVVPDGEDVLFDPRGNVVPGVKFDWPGKRTYTWPPGSMLREFVFELGPGSENLEFIPNNPGFVSPADNRGWMQNATYAVADDRVPSPDGRQRFLFSASISTNYWRSALLFGGSQFRLTEIVVELHFFGNTRGTAALTFEGPFAWGKTNSTRESNTYRLTPQASSSLQGPESLSPENSSFAVWWTGYGGYWSQIFAYDTDGKRHLAQSQATGQSPIGGTNQFVIRGAPVERITAITFGEEPRVKRFHNVIVDYPNRPPRPHAAALDRLDAALGKTNTSAASLEHFYPDSTREAMTVLEHLPGHRNAVNALANARSSTNFSELTPAQREKLRALAAAWASGSDGYERDVGLRLGLRGPWPEFLALALARLTNGPTQDRVNAASALSWTRTQIGAENVPILLALAWTNAVGDVSANILGILQHAGPAGTNALLELARADAPWIWWGAISRLPTRAFAVATLSEEMQQRLWLAWDRTNLPISLAVRTAAQARLPGLLTPELQRRNPHVFTSALRKFGRHSDRATAMAGMMKYLRDLPPGHLQSYTPFEVVQQVNAWYDQNFGGLGTPSSNSFRSPTLEEWPGVIQEVLEFYEKLKKDGAVAAEK